MKKTKNFQNFIQTYLFLERTGEEVTKQQLKKADEIMKGVYSKTPSLDYLIPLLLEFGIEELPQKVSLIPGISRK
jgi:DNA ligase-1